MKRATIDQRKRYNDRVGELFRFRLERLSRPLRVRKPSSSRDVTNIVLTVILEDLRGGAPISKYSKVVSQAAEQDDLGTLERIVCAKKKKGHGRLRRIHPIDDVIFWNYDELTGDFALRTPKIPGLKFWTDKAAAAFVAAKIREPSFSAEAYKKRRLRLKLHPEQPAIIVSMKFVPRQSGSDVGTVTLESRDRFDSQICPKPS